MSIDVSKIKVGDTVWVKAVVVMTDPGDINHPIQAVVLDYPEEPHDFWPCLKNIVGWEKQKPLLRIGAIVKGGRREYQGEVFAYDNKEVVIKCVDHGCIVLKIDEIEVLS